MAPGDCERLADAAVFSTCWIVAAMIIGVPDGLSTPKATSVATGASALLVHAIHVSRSYRANWMICVTV